MRDTPRMSLAARPTCWTANGCGLCIAMGCWPPPFVQRETLACCAAICGQIGDDPKHTDNAKAWLFSVLVLVVRIALDRQKGRFYDHAHETDIPNRPCSCSGFAGCRVNRDEAACLCAGDIDH